MGEAEAEGLLAGEAAPEGLLAGEAAPEGLLAGVAELARPGLFKTEMMSFVKSMLSRENIRTGTPFILIPNRSHPGSAR